ncbi:DUF485 domain-containing protein [Streptomyces sp. HM190]|uniref:DUF485 domain-containing protein n=1 Tax=Streptomyces sp. HM190 TaxID=2695266 RepID=UPI0013580275|nr:DUF485 domain-containing protein [Streptomyces sp. HM190]
MVSDSTARYGSSVPHQPPSEQRGDPFSPAPAPRGPAAGRQSIHAHPEFRSVSAAYRRFGTWATVLSVGAFLSYVVLSSFAPGVMNQRLAGHLTLGLALALAQFAVIGMTAWLYVRHMRKNVDPVVRRLRAQVEDHEGEQRRLPAGRRLRAW